MKKTIIIKVSLGFSCPNHSCKTTFGWALSVKNQKHVDLISLEIHQGDKGWWSLAASFLGFAKTQTSHTLWQPSCWPPAVSSGRSSHCISPVPSRFSLTIRPFSWSILAARRMLLTPPTCLTGLWKRDQSCNEVSGWLWSYLDQQAIFAAITVILNSKPTVREVFQLGFLDGKIFCFYGGWWYQVPNVLGFPINQHLHISCKTCTYPAKTTAILTLGSMVNISPQTSWGNKESSLQGEEPHSPVGLMSPWNPQILAY